MTRMKRKLSRRRRFCKLQLLRSARFVRTNVHTTLPRVDTATVESGELGQLSDDGTTGFMSITGVPSIASMGPRCRRVASMASTLVRCRPMGLGRAGDRVEK